jgi:hypothetical protein
MAQPRRLMFNRLSVSFMEIVSVAPRITTSENQRPVASRMGCAVIRNVQHPSSIPQGFSNISVHSDNCVLEMLYFLRRN